MTWEPPPVSGSCIGSVINHVVDGTRVGCTLDEEPDGCAGIAEGCPMQWRPNPDIHGDQQNSARFVARLGFSEQDWNDAHALVHDIFRQPAVKRASSELFYRLLETPILDGDQARAIYDDACALGAA